MLKFAKTNSTYENCGAVTIAKDIGKLGTKSINANGTYTAENDNLNGYSEVTVSVPSKVAQLIDKSITSLTKEDLYGLTTIPQSAFNECRSLSTVELPDSVTTLGLYAFSNCASLTTVDFGNGLTTLNNDAFYYCRNLQSVDLPATITNIGRAFGLCWNIQYVVVRAINPPVLADGDAFPYSYPIYVPAESVEAYKAATNWSAYASRIQAIPS